MAAKTKPKKPSAKPKASKSHRPQFFDLNFDGGQSEDPIPKPRLYFSRETARAAAEGWLRANSESADSHCPANVKIVGFSSDGRGVFAEKLSLKPSIEIVGKDIAGEYFRS